MHFKDTIYDVAIIPYDIKYITNFQLFNECSTIFFSVLSVTCLFHTFVTFLMYLFDIKFFLSAINCHSLFTYIHITYYNSALVNT